jgi:hypothetical protein
MFTVAGGVTILALAGAAAAVVVGAGGVVVKGWGTAVPGVTGPVGVKAPVAGRGTTGCAATAVFGGVFAATSESGYSRPFRVSTTESAFASYLATV